MSLLSELQRRRKDNRLILGLILAVLVVWAAVSVVEQRADEPTTITRGLLLFVLSYTNITLIVALLFVLGRTILKTWVERRRRILGSQFKTKLLVTYLGLTAIPIGLLFGAKPALANVADAELKHHGLDALLWAQGVRRRDWFRR